MKIRRKIALLLMLAIAASCSTSKFVKPLEKGEQAAGFNLGGPIIKMGGAIMPIPYTSLDYAFGLSNKTTAYGSIHTTALAYGVFQAELGFISNLKQQNGLCPAISVSPSMNFMVDMYVGNRYYLPQLDLNFYWENKSKNRFVYTGLSSYFDINRFKAHDEKQTHHWFPCPKIGNTFVRSKWNYNIEIKYMGLGISNEDIIVDYFKPTGKTGVMGIYFGIVRKIK
ncbi:MAG: hypothetical protein WCK02_04870 [Bacteroidota bacterium]